LRLYFLFVHSLSTTILLSIVLQDVDPEKSSNDRESVDTSGDHESHESSVRSSDGSSSGSSIVENKAAKVFIGSSECYHWGLCIYSTLKLCVKIVNLSLDTECVGLAGFWKESRFSQIERNPFSVSRGFD